LSLGREIMKNPRADPRPCLHGTNTQLAMMRKTKIAATINHDVNSSIRSIVPPKSNNKTERSITPRATIHSVEPSCCIGKRPTRLAKSTDAQAEARADQPTLRKARRQYNEAQKARAWPEAHDSAIYGFTRVERISNGFQVEKDLQYDRNGGDPEDSDSILGSGRRPPPAILFLRSKQPGEWLQARLSERNFCSRKVEGLEGPQLPMLPCQVVSLFPSFIDTRGQSAAKEGSNQPGVWSPTT